MVSAEVVAAGLVLGDAGLAEVKGLLKLHS